MNRTFANYWFSIWSLALSQGAFAADAWDAELAVQQASHPAVAEQVVQMLYLTPLLPAAAIQDQIDAVIADPNLAEPAREKILRDYAWQLRNLAPAAVALGALHSLAAYPASVLVVHPESRGNRLVPLFDIASAARGTINQWLHESARATAAADLDQGSIEFVRTLNTTAHYQQIAGTADAVRVAPYASVELLRGSLTAVLARSPRFTPIVLAAAYRLQHEGLLRLAIEHGDDPAPAINRLFDFVNADQAGVILFELATGKDSKLAGLAITALARHAHSINGVSDFLLTIISDRERGAAAALALAQIASPRVMADLAKVLNHPPDKLSQSRAALSLKLNGSELALATLREFAHGQPEHRLSLQVQQWLR